MRRIAAEDDVEAPAAAMAAVRSPDGGNTCRVPGCGEPVMDGSTDRAAPDRRLARAFVAGDQEQNAIARRNGLLERSVDRPPCRVEVHSVQVDDAVGLDASAAEPAVPAAVQSRSGTAAGDTGRGRGTWG